MHLDLTSNVIVTQNNKFRVTAVLQDYRYEKEPTQQEFVVELNNPCGTGNEVIFRDRSQYEFGTIPITTGCNKEVINLVNTFTDEFTEDGGLGHCGTIDFELGWKGVVPQDYPFISLNHNSTIMTIESTDPEEEGTYLVPFSAVLTAYPNAAPYKEYITIEIVVE